jgi:hypothetical protein
MAINDATTGLKNTINTINELDLRLRKNTEAFTNKPFPAQVGQGTVTNKKPIIWQIRDIPDKYKLPDLAMNINPDSLKSSYKQLIRRKRTLGGFLEEHWGEELDSLSLSGKSATFFGELGLTNKTRRDTDAYREFEKLTSIYRNNGTLYDEKSGTIVAQGSVIMIYDSVVYRGFFESFEINEIAEKQFNLQYSLAFKVSQELFPGRIKSFINTTTVLRPGANKNDVVTLDITT